jgi:uncharacterized membrane protein YeaQ/YmgE (transglycosylase-associated protein family)
MEFSVVSLLLYLLIAAIAGGIARAIAGGTGGGCLVSIAVGFIGSLLGPVIARKLGLPEPFLIRIDGGPGFPFLWAIIGASLFVAVVVLLSGGRREG